MKILAIETSCDETAVALLEADGALENASFAVRGNALYSQAEKHAAFGGVYPSLAKREHAENLVPLLIATLREAGLYDTTSPGISDDDRSFIVHTLAREERLAHLMLRDLSRVAPPPVDYIAVTHGPGLEPALWVGVNFARTLARVWNVPIIPVNHLEGHLVASAVDSTGLAPASYHMANIVFPALGLVVSGGHTEFVYATAWGTYQKIGGTRDDSVGEAFDKVARILDLPYPGGPEIGRLAEKGRLLLAHRDVTFLKDLKPLPRPMIGSDDYDFSFSGLKTAVKYLVRDLGAITEEQRTCIAAEFQQAAVDVLCAKTARALAHMPVRTFLLGGGVSADQYLRTQLTELLGKTPEVTFRVPAPGLSTDNALMIGMCAYLAQLRGTPTRTASDDLRADGNLTWDTDTEVTSS